MHGYDIESFGEYGFADNMYDENEMYALNQNRMAA